MAIFDFPNTYLHISRDRKKQNGKTVYVNGEQVYSFVKKKLFNGSIVTRNKKSEYDKSTGLFHTVQSRNIRANPEDVTSQDFKEGEFIVFLNFLSNVKIINNSLFESGKIKAKINGVYKISKINEVLRPSDNSQLWYTKLTLRNMNDIIEEEETDFMNNIVKDLNIDFSGNTSIY